MCNFPLSPSRFIFKNSRFIFKEADGNTMQKAAMQIMEILISSLTWINRWYKAYLLPYWTGSKNQMEGMHRYLYEIPSSIWLILNTAVTFAIPSKYCKLSKSTEPISFWIKARKMYLKATECWIVNVLDSETCLIVALCSISGQI